MLGGYNITPLIDLLDDAGSRPRSPPPALKKTLLMFDQFHDVAGEGRRRATRTPRPCCRAGPTPSGSPSRPEVPQSITVSVFKVARRDQHRRPVARARRLEPPRHPAARAGDAEEPAPRHHARGRRQARPGPVHRGAARAAATSSPTSATSSAPARAASRRPTRCSGSPARTSRSCRTSASAASASARKIAPIFYNTMEDSGALPIELDVSRMEMGDVIELRPYEGKALKNGEVDRRVQASRATCCSTRCAPAAAFR